MVSPFPGMYDKSYAGYITVNQTYNSNLFFWFFPARVGVQGLQWRAGSSSLQMECEYELAASWVLLFVFRCVPVHAHMCVGVHARVWVRPDSIL